MDRIRQHLEAGYPNEACGALIGRADGDNHTVEEFRGMRNTIIDRPWDRYALDPLEQLRVQKDAESRPMFQVCWLSTNWLSGMKDSGKPPATSKTN